MDKDNSRIILGVTGGIAAYKAADLCSKLTQAGAEVRVAFSNSAHEFVTPLVFEALSAHPVYQHMFGTSSSYEMEHISWARWADKFVIAPTTADTIARMAHGEANDAITTLYLAFRGPVFLAPSMNTAMLEHPATQANLATLEERGVTIIRPGAGSLACGETGSGRMAEPLEIMAAIDIQGAATAAVSQAAQPEELSRPADNSLAGTTVLITSGPTREYLDPVRFLSSPSTGRMGLALANEAARRGAHVHFVTGPVDASLLPAESSDHITIHKIQGAREMLQVVQDLKPACNLFIFTAAVGDFRPAQPLDYKIKRTGNSITLPLVENPDIAQAVGFSKMPHQVLIGFAAETNDHETNAQAKLEAKHLDAIVLNDVSGPDVGFASPDNEVRIVTTRGEMRQVSKRPKPEVAFEILEVARELLDMDDPV